MGKNTISENPQLMREWDNEKNGNLHPEDFTGGSEQKIWWRCEHGHGWQARLNNRTKNLGTNCPYCAGKKVWPGFNDLASTHPHLAAEWNYEKNDDLHPEDVTASSNKKVWWRCPSGHSWLAMINNRKKGQGCPYDAGKMAWPGFNDLPTTQPRISAEWDNEKNGELYPDQFTAGSHAKVWWKCKHGHSWKATIYSRQKCGCPYCSGRLPIPGITDLKTVNPILADEWDYAMNAPLRPENVAANTCDKAWWKCKKGHNWKAAVSNRNNGNGCPYCANRFVLKGYNDLLSAAPDLCEEWDYEKNAPLQPDEVTSNTSRSVWWKCIKGHSWKAMIVHRRRGNGCPVCAGKIVIAGDNDLKTLRSDISIEWDYEKNGELLPDQLTVQSTRRVWWRCKHGHSYNAVVYNRFNGTDCPYCAGNLPIIGETDLATIHPELLSEWDYVKNNVKTPEQYTSCSNTKVWWKCKEGHNWQAAICDRHLGHRCPYCIGKLAINGVNDAATLYPELIDEWDFDRNRDLTLGELLPNSSKKALWKCKHGHSWKASVQSRVFGTGCPYCKGKMPLKTRLVK